MALVEEREDPVVGLEARYAGADGEDGTCAVGAYDFKITESEDVYS